MTLIEDEPRNWDYFKIEGEPKNEDNLLIKMSQKMKNQWKTKQAEAEVVPSSSSVRFKLDLKLR